MTAEDQALVQEVLTTTTDALARLSQSKNAHIGHIANLLKAAVTMGELYLSMESKS